MKVETSSEGWRRLASTSVYSKTLIWLTPPSRPNNIREGSETSISGSVRIITYVRTSIRPSTKVVPISMKFGM